MADPILTYDILTNPTPVEVSKGVTISLVVSNGTQNYVSLSSIQFRLPGQGTNAKDLSADQSNIPTSSNQDGWTITQSGSAFTITPNSTASGTVTPARIGGQGLVFNFGPIPVNDEPGTTEVTVAEDTGSGMSDTQPFPISKWPQEFSIGNFRASHPSVLPGATVQLAWDMTGDATLNLEYQNIKVQNPDNPYTTQGLATTTLFTLTADSSYNGNPVSVSLQTTVEVEVPKVLSLYAEFDIVYSGQGNTLYWETAQADSATLKANGVVQTTSAPLSTGASGFPIDAKTMQKTTTFELDAIKGSQDSRLQYNAFAKVLLLDGAFATQPGWGQVTLDQQGQNAYVCNSHTNAIDVVPLSTGVATSSITAGLGPRGISLSADDSMAYVSNAFDETVSVIDLSNGSTVDTIDITSPAGSCLIGNSLFVASMASGGGKVEVINVETRMIAQTIDVGGSPFDVAVTPDGQTLDVANNAGTTVDVFEIATGQKSSSVTVGDAPTTVAPAGNGASIYAGSRLGTDITVIDAHIDTPAVTTTVSAHLNPAGIGVSGSGQYLVAIGPGGFFVFELGLPGAQMTFAAKEVPSYKS